MLDDDAPANLPPPHLLDALRRPRPPQLDDARVRELLSRWKRLGRPIEYVDLNQVAAIIAPHKPSAKTRRKIVAAVEAARIEIRSYEGMRKSLNENFAHVSLTGDAMFAMAEESRWREPEAWDNRPPPKPVPWMEEQRLDWEYGPTAERHSWQREHRRRGGLARLLEDLARRAP